MMNLSSALSTLLVLLGYQNDGSQSFSLLQGRRNVAKLSSSQENNAAGVRNGNHFEAVTAISSNHRWLSTSPSWVEAATLPQLDDSLLGGNRISMSGDGTFLAAAPLFYGADYAGIVRFYQKQEPIGSWKEIINFRLTGDAEYDFFGSDVSLSKDGKRVAIGAEGDSHEMEYAGSVSVFEMDSDGISEWSLMGDVIHGKSENGGSGSSVALSYDGSTLAVGAYVNNGTNDGFSNSGYVRVFHWDVNASSFNQLGEDILGEVSGDYFGFSVALSDDGLVVAIGAPHFRNLSNSGSVRVFYWDGKEKKWSMRGSKIQGDASIRAFGNSVDLSADGNFLAIGSPQNIGTGGNFTSFGAAQVFQWKDDWVQVGQTLEGTYESGEFGESVSLSSDGSVLAAGGSLYVSPKNPLTVFSLVDNQWEGLGGAVRGTTGAEVSLSSNGETIAVGYPDDDGAITVYNLAIDNSTEPTSAPASAAACSPTFLFLFLLILPSHVLVLM
eukprot:scaffold4901_cov105-Cylindrotheca_fusiformis.AAC.3